MAGKKKKKGKKRKEEPEPEDEYMTMRGEQLEITITNLKEKLDQAKMQRNTLQIEKDMIHDFYMNTRDEIRDLQAQIQNFDTKMQQEEESHHTLVVSHQQKVQHHEYEHEDNIGNIKVMGHDIMTEEDSHHTVTEQNNRSSKTNKKEDYMRNDQANQSEIESEAKAHQQNIDQLDAHLEMTKVGLI